MKVKVLNAQTQIEIRVIDLQDFLTRSGECLMGRSPSSGLVLESSDISRLHGKFVLDQGQYYFYDLGSANGSLVNGAIAQANHGYLLRSGDIVRIGEYVLMMQAPFLEDLPATVIGDPNATVVGGQVFGMVMPPELTAVEEVAVMATDDEIVADEIEDEIEDEVEDEIEDEIGDKIVEDEIVDEEEVLEDAPIDTATDEVLEEATVDEVIEEAEDESATVLQGITSNDLLEIQPEFLDTSDVTAPVLTPDPWSDPSIVPGAIAVPLASTPTELPIPESEPTAVPTVDSISPPSDAEIDSLGDRTVIQPADLISLDLTDDSPGNATVVQPTDNEVDTVVNQLFDSEPPTIPGTIPPVADPSPSSTESLEISSLEPDYSELLHTLQEKYIVLLAHDNQESELIQLIESYQPFLARCQTLTTPALSDTLKQQIGFTVSHQTPALLQGGYQSVNGLITGGKIIAVLFARDFLTPQSTQSNDDALSRSCNVYGVLFASNLPTAEAIIHSLQTKVASVQ
jgi:methylglyoxal synthase/predicted component of type VI protein secretion system